MPTGMISMPFLSAFSSFFIVDSVFPAPYLNEGLISAPVRFELEYPYVPACKQTSSDLPAGPLSSDTA